MTVTSLRRLYGTGTERSAALERIATGRGFAEAPSSRRGEAIERALARADAGGALERVTCADVHEQVACLLDQATDANVTMHAWLGWRPWL